MCKYTKVSLFLVLLGLQLGCDSQAETTTAVPASKARQIADGPTIGSRFEPPSVYLREAASENSFAFYLRALPLYPPARPVRLYNDALKGNQSAQAAVVNMDVGSRDLQQCADAVMRLRAEYLWSIKAYERIQFNFTSGFKADYPSWRAGQRIVVDGNDVHWTTKKTADESYAAFRKYLNQVFIYAGTYSLSKELKKVSIEDLQIGDVFIHGGFPGHAVIVVDLAIHPTKKDKAFLLAQSYMPAQDIHVLKNPKGNSAWYFISELGTELSTPEWTFQLGDLSRF